MRKFFRTLLCTALTGLLAFSSAVIAGADTETSTVEANPDGYSIVLYNTANEKTYEVKADDSEGLFETVTATFTVEDSGSYDVLVYAFNSEGGNNSLCTMNNGYMLTSGETVKVYYTWSTDELQVKDDMTDDSNLSAYTVVLRNTETEEEFSSNAIAADTYDTFYATLDVKKGTYDVFVYWFDDEAKDNVLCTQSQVELSGDGYLTVFYYTAINEVEFESDAVVKNDSTENSEAPEDEATTDVTEEDKTEADGNVQDEAEAEETEPEGEPEEEPNDEETDENTADTENDDNSAPAAEATDNKQSGEGEKSDGTTAVNGTSKNGTNGTTTAANSTTTGSKGTSGSTTSNPNTGSTSTKVTVLVGAFVIAAAAVTRRKND